MQGTDHMQELARDGGWPCMTREKEKDAVGAMQIGLVQLVKKQAIVKTRCRGPKKKRLGLRLA